MLGLVSTWMGDCLCAGRPSQYVTSHISQVSQLSLAIPAWVGVASSIVPARAAA